MNKHKAFWISFFTALGVLLPLYGAVWLHAAANRPAQTPAAAEQAGVPVNEPRPGDSRNLFVIAGNTEPVFFLIRFDAFQARCTVAALRPDTLLRAPQGGAVTLRAAWDYAGPGYAADRLAETLGLDLHHYLQLADGALTETGSAIGPVRLDMDALHTAEAEGLAAENSAALSAQNIAALLKNTSLSPDKKAAFLGRVISLFAACGADRLKTLVPDLMRSEGALSTNAFAADIYEYERLLAFFAERPPVCNYFVFDGTAAGGGFELAQTAPEQALAYFS